MSFSTRPAPDEFAPGYRPYLDPVSDPLSRLAAQPDELAALLAGSEGLHRYAPGKWSVREVVAHLSDVERVMAYRLLRIARGDQTPLPGFDDEAWVAASEHDRRPLSEHLAEFRAARANTLALLAGLPGAAADRRGMAGGVPVTARALAWILAGHVDHHARILRDRYGLPQGPASGDLSE